MIGEEEQRDDLRVVRYQVHATDLEHAERHDGQYQTLEEARFALRENVGPACVAFSFFFQSSLDLQHGKCSKTARNA